MTRSVYGGSLADYGIDSQGKPQPLAVYPVWSAAVGGSQITDLLDDDDNPVTSAVADDHGFIRFSGPDGFDGDLWLQGAVTTPRLLIRPVDLTDRVGAVETAVGALDPDAITTAAVAAATSALGGTLVARSTLTWNLLKNFGSGLGEGDVAADHDALQDFLDACGTAGDAVGVIPPAPSGVYLTTGELVLPAYAQVQGPDPSSRYFGLASTTPRTAGAIQLAPGSTATALIRPDSTFTAASIRDLTLLGDNELNASAQPVHGIAFDVPATEHSLRAENVAIIGMTGDGIRGTLWAQRWTGLFVGGCKGWGISITGSDRATDVWIHQAILNGNLLGGINVDSTGGSGMVHVTGRTRIERSGWDPAAASGAGGLATGGTGAPGVRIRGNIFNSSFDISTDANAGPGVTVVRISGRSIHDLKVSGVLARDGWYDMTNGASGGTHPQPAIEVVGYSGGSVDYVDLTGLSITGGKARDDASAPAYYHPAVGAAFDSASFVTWPDVQIDPSIVTEYTVGSLGLFQSQIAGRAGTTSVHIGPVYDTEADRPGETGQGPAVVGMTGWDAENDEPIWYDGTDWVPVASGGGGSPTGSAGGSLAGTYPNPTLAANSVGASQITDGSVGAAEIADGSVGAAEIADGSITNAEVSSSAAIALSKLATDPLARANHTGTQTASTVSDFNTAVRTNRLDQMATPTGAVAMGSQKITGLGTPTASTDAATKAYADSVGSGGAGNAPLNALDYLFGDGRLEADADVTAMCAAWASTKKALYFPAGTYFINPGFLKPAHNGAIMYGDGIGPTVISRNGNGVLLDVSGTNQTTLRQNVTVRDMTLYGGGGTGTLVRAYYTTLLDMERVLFSSNAGIGFEGVQLWDSKFLFCDWENINSTTEAAINILSSKAASGFGTSTDNSNAIRFYGCRVELSKFAAINIGRGDATGSNPHDIVFDGLKIETHEARGATIRVDSQSNMILFNKVFIFVGGFDSGFSTPINAIDWAPWQGSTLRDVNISCSGNFLASGVFVNGADDTRLDAVKGELTVAPTSGNFVNVGSGVTLLSATDITTDNGTAIGGTPVSYAPVIPATGAGVTQAYVDSATFLNAKTFLKGDGTLESDSSVTAMVSAWATGKRTLYFPAGTYLINPGLLKFPADGLVLRGDGRDSTIIKKNANGILLDCSGTDDSNYRSMISIHDVRLHGGDKTGSLVRAYYTKHLKMRDVWNYGNNGAGLEGVALWDSYFDSVDWEWCWSTTIKAIVLRNSNATSGFGFSGDTTNALRFVGCRIETFAAGAFLIESGTGSTFNPHDIILVACKIESANCIGGASGHFIDVAAGADDIVIHRLYTNVGGLQAGGTKVPAIIRFKPSGNSSIVDAFLSSNGDFLDLGMEVAFSNKTRIQGIRGKYTLAPTTGNHVSITGGCADFTAQDVTSNFGTALAGNPTSWAVRPGAQSVVQTFTSSGTWTKPIGAKSITVAAIGGGGGGGGGRRDASVTTRCGGGGGGGAGRTLVTLDAAAVGTTETVTVGSGGTAGTAATADTTSGGNGGAGGNTTFGSHVRAGGGFGGGGGTGSTGTGGASGAGLLAGGTGGAASTIGGPGAAASGVNGAASGGGAGGGITSGDMPGAGGAGVAPAMHAYAAGTGGAVGSPGAAPTAVPTGLGIPGSGPGGGGGSITGAGGAGGAGNVGSGGGGGGASANGSVSGAGGAGGAGIVVVTSTF